MNKETLKAFIEQLEKDRDEAQASIWFDFDKKYDTLDAFDKAIDSLKTVAFLMYDLELE